MKAARKANTWHGVIAQLQRVVDDAQDLGDVISTADQAALSKCTGKQLLALERVLCNVIDAALSRLPFDVYTACATAFGVSRKDAKDKLLAVAYGGAGSASPAGPIDPAPWLPGGPSADEVREHNERMQRLASKPIDTSRLDAPDRTQVVDARLDHYAAQLSDLSTKVEQHDKIINAPLPVGKAPKDLSPEDMRKMRDLVKHNDFRPIMSSTPASRKRKARRSMDYLRDQMRELHDAAASVKADAELTATQHTSEPRDKLAWQVGYLQSHAESVARSLARFPALLEERDARMRDDLVDRIASFLETMDSADFGGYSQIMLADKIRELFNSDDDDARYGRTPLGEPKGKEPRE